MEPVDAIRVMSRAIDQGDFARFVYDLCAHREMSDVHAVGDSRKRTVSLVRKALMKALHSDRATGIVSQLGSDFGFLEKMAYKISIKLGGIEEEIAGEFRRRQ
eukprot:8923730-Alexandrium_andersonii.AAC.1